MGTLYLVRHGQASFGAADYDQLSTLGQRQCRRLGEHLRARRLKVAACYSGTLRRQRQSLDAIAEGFGALPPAQRLPGLNEYDSLAVVQALYPEPPAPPADAKEAFRHHFRLLRDGLMAWMEGRTTPGGMPSHADFSAGVAAAMDLARGHADADGLVLMVSSGGPIATAVGQVLGLAPASVVDLNMRIRNSALTEFEFNTRRHRLVGFNSIAHLEHGADSSWITYA